MLGAAESAIEEFANWEEFEKQDLIDEVECPQSFITIDPLNDDESDTLEKLDDMMERHYKLDLLFIFYHSGTFS